MLTRLFVAISLLFSIATTTTALANDPWYIQKEKPVTLKAALAADKEFLGANNIDYRMMSNKKVCAAFKAVKLPCDYNTRVTVSMFLSVNGKGIFPTSGKTNPYVSGDIGLPEGFPDDTFIGQPTQNNMLAVAIQRNAKLFRDGDLTAEAVQKNWR